MERIVRRKFTAQFRAVAIRMVLDQGLSIAETAQRLEMSDKSLERGTARAAPGGGTAPRSVSELEAEVSRLRAENARLKTQREILRRATAFFPKV
jgi:transposase